MAGNSIYPNEVYDYERGGVVYTGRPTEWAGKIALPYLSDYGYAADLGKCTKQLINYSDSTCASNNWMYSIMAPNYGWSLLTFTIAQTLRGISLRQTILSSDTTS